MEVKIDLTVKHADVAKEGGPALAVMVSPGSKLGPAAKALDATLGGAIARAVSSGDLKGRPGDVTTIYPGGKGPDRVLLLGAGDPQKFGLEEARLVGGAFAAALRDLKAPSGTIALDGPGTDALAERLGRGIAEGLLMGAYKYDNYFRDGRGEPLKLSQVTILAGRKERVAGVKRGVELGTRIALSVNQARELMNGPSNEVTPTFLAETAKRLGREHGFSVKVLDREQCEKEKMGAFLGVARGSHEPPRFIVMEYKGKNPKGTVCFVGKGITFDTGGISLKPAGDMDQMKYDMGGAAAVISALRFAASQGVPLHVVGLVAATENMPGGSAYKPGDILVSKAGVTIEVLNTDAEGRVILADALAYAEKFKPDAVIDLATLTGACVIALGGHASGLMGNDEWLLDRVWEASNVSGDRAWPLPLWSEYRDMVKSNVADIKNSTGRSAGAITAAAFLGAFTNAYRWVHLDIAGTAWGEGAKPYLGGGGTGAGVRILAEVMLGWTKPKGKGPVPGARTSLRRLPAEDKKESAKKRVPGQKRD